MGKRFNQQRIFQILDRYFEQGGAGGAGSPNLDQILKDDGSGVAIPRAILVRCEIGLALKKLNKREHHAVLSYYWTLQTYLRADIARGHANNARYKVGPKRTNGEQVSKRKLDRLVKLFVRYSNTAQNNLVTIGKQREFRSGMTKLGEQLARAF